MSRSPARLAWYRLRATLHRRLGGYLALAILVGLIGGVVGMASVTAARRTDSSSPDYLAGTNPSALTVPRNSQSNVPPAQACPLYLHLPDQLRHLPHVQGMVTADALNAALLTPRGEYGPVLVAALPGRQAARTPAAEVLRTE